MTAISPDLSINISNTLYLIVAHNYIPALYLACLIISLILLIKKPTRSHTFLFLGFLLLLFQFEYVKHIVDGLKEQTTNSLITATPHYTAKKWLNSIIEDITPIILFVSAWISLILAYFSKKD